MLSFELELFLSAPTRKAVSAIDLLDTASHPGLLEGILSFQIKTAATESTICF